ncbi:MAG: ATP phosphoribosyltransferase [Maricaulaceae bacterium]|jgi:ATP phosphoribosyltransferase
MTLRIGFPSKGRLIEPATAYFKDCGLEVDRSGGDRSYQGGIKGLPGVEVWFLSTAEIAQSLRDGRLHVGLTGEDVLAEWSTGIEDAALKLRPLGFGQCDVVAAVPAAWIDVTGANDLADVAAEFPRRYGQAMRVATKYVNLTERTFARWGVKNYRIVVSPGATEAAPASGLAEVIVDITTSGATLAANNLRPLTDDVILKSQACLFASLRADWSAEDAPALETILSRMEARVLAKAYKLVSFANTATASDLVRTLECGFEAIPALDAEAKRAGAAAVYVPADRALAAAAFIQDVAQCPVNVASLDMIFDRSGETSNMLRRIFRPSGPRGGRA